VYVNLTDPSIVLVEENDLLILWDGSKAGEIVPSKYGALSSTMAKIHLHDNNVVKSYLNYFLKLSEGYLQSNTVGMGITHVNGELLYNLFVPTPSLVEQKQIAKFLDQKTSIIDEIISKKNLFIELIEEKGQAILNEAITLGVDRGVPLQETEMQWLDKIPITSELIPLRFLNNKIGSGVTPKGGGEVYSEDGVTFIRSQNVHFDGLRLDDVVRIDYETHEKMSGSKVFYKDVLLNITGASIGRSCVVYENQDMNVNQHVCIIRPNDRITPEYLNLVLQSYVGQTQIKLGTTGGNREGLTFEAIKDFIIPLPDLVTQQSIVSIVGAKMKKIELLKSQSREIVEKLKDYRTSLIAEAVTGKMDLRNWEPDNQKLQIAEWQEIQTYKSNFSLSGSSLFIWKIIQNRSQALKPSQVLQTAGQKQSFRLFQTTIA